LADEPNPYWRAYFPLAILIGVRKTELLSARWEDVDFTHNNPNNGPTLRIPTRKTGEELLVPLPVAAVSILRSLPSYGTSEFVFPGEGKSGHLIEVRNAWERVRNRAKVEGVTIHDLRRTLGSWLGGRGYSLQMIGKALGHRSPTGASTHA
jgi:integrase